jgi:hypothetical protein
MKFSNVLLFVIFSFLTLNVFAYLYNPYEFPNFPISSKFIERLNPISLANYYGIGSFWVIPQWFIAYLLFPILLLMYIFNTLISLFEYGFNIIFYFNNFFPAIISAVIDFSLLSLLIVSFISSLKLGGSGIE